MRMSLTSRPLARIARAAGLAMVVLAGSAVAADKPLARYVPKDELLLYAEFSGLDAHADAWKKTAFFKMLNETTAGSMFSEVVSQTVGTALANSPLEEKPTGKDVVAGIERVARSGFAFGVLGKIGGPQYRAVIVVRDAGGKELGKGTRGMLDLLAKSGAPIEKVTREDGRKVTTMKAPNESPAIAWWFEGDDLVVVVSRGEATVEAVVETLAGKRPSAVDSPTRVELAKTVDGFEPVFVSFIDLADLPPTPPSFGLSGLKRIESRWGFQDKTLVSITRVVAPSPRKGLLALVDHPTFEKSIVMPVPAGLKDYSVVSIDPGKLFDDVVSIAKQADPNSEATIKGLLDAAKGVLGVSVRDELIGQLGPKMAFYIEPELAPVPLTPYQSVADWAFHPPRLTAVIEVRDSARFARTLDTLMDVANRQIADAMKDAPPHTLVKFKRLKGDDRGYVLDVPLGAFPLPAAFRPTLLLGKGYLALAISPKAAKKALSFESAPAGKPVAEVEALPPKLMALNMNDPSGFVPDLVANVPFFVQALASLSRGNPTPLGAVRLDIDADKIPDPDALRPYLFPGTLSVSVDDRGVELVSRDSVPSINPLAAAPVAAALLLPATQQARLAAKRAQSVNNLKQVMLAMHNYHSANNVFPPAAIADAEGKPLLSWRVAILPYLEQQELYNEFHLDEPWDSEHNKKLIPRMPVTYKSPNTQPKDPNSTFYQVFTGNGALFDGKGHAQGLQDVTDGTSNTIAVVEAGTAVIWSKPDDIPFEPDKDLPKFGGLGFAGGFNAGFADGSVRFLKFSVLPEILKALITRAGGEVISADMY